LALGRGQNSAAAAALHVAGSGSAIPCRSTRDAGNDHVRSRACIQRSKAPADESCGLPGRSAMREPDDCHLALVAGALFLRQFL